MQTFDGDFTKILVWSLIPYRPLILNFLSQEGYLPNALLSPKTHLLRLQKMCAYRGDPMVIIYWIFS